MDLLWNPTCRLITHRIPWIQSYIIYLSLFIYGENHPGCRIASCHFVTNIVSYELRVEKLIVE